MGITRRKLKSWLVGSMFWLFASSVHAGLIGDELNAVWDYGSFADEHTFVGSEGIDLDGNWGFYNDLDVKDSSIEVVFNYTGALLPGVTWLFSEIDTAIESIDVKTNYLGWEDSFLTYGSHFVQIVFDSAVDFNRDTNYFEVFLTQEVAEVEVVTVSEPGPLALMALGLLLMLCYSRYSNAVKRS